MEAVGAVSVKVDGTGCVEAARRLKDVVDAVEVIVGALSVSVRSFYLTSLGPEPNLVFVTVVQYLRFHLIFLFIILSRLSLVSRFPRRIYKVLT